MTHIERQIERAHETIRHLSRRGFVVLGMKASCYGAKPTIEIAHTPVCNELRGTPTVEFTSAGAVRQYTVALVGDCRVQWREN